MSYADALKGRFPGLDPVVDDLFLLEAHQIQSLPTRAPLHELAAVLHTDPRLSRFFVARHPPIQEFLDRLLSSHRPVPDDELARCQDTLVWEIADWILYQRAPDLYDESSEFDLRLTAVVDLVQLDGKVVIDAGAATGRVAIAAARTARHVFAVEPSAALRAFIRDRATDLGIDNLFVLDGFLDSIPLPADIADVLLTRQAIGWRLVPELAEIERVVAPGRAAVHLVGPPAEFPDDRLDQTLTAEGYQRSSYSEGSVTKARYWKRF